MAAQMIFVAGGEYDNAVMTFLDAKLLNNSNAASFTFMVVFTSDIEVQIMSFHFIRLMSLAHLTRYLNSGSQSKPQEMRKLVNITRLLSS